MSLRAETGVQPQRQFLPGCLRGCRGRAKQYPAGDAQQGNAQRERRPPRRMDAASFRHCPYLLPVFRASRAFGASRIQLLQHLVDKTHRKYVHPIMPAPVPITASAAAAPQNQETARVLAAPVSFAAKWICRAVTFCLPWP